MPADALRGIRGSQGKQQPFLGLPAVHVDWSIFIWVNIIDLLLH
jgi:hypothetical protein